MVSLISSYRLEEDSMGIFRRRAEVRADAGEVQFEDTLLKALLGGGPVTRETALQVPTISGGIDLIANLVASTPVKLYRDKGGKTRRCAMIRELPC